MIYLYSSTRIIEFDMEIGDRTGMVMIYRYGSRTGFLGVLAPSVSIKDRLLSAVLIGD